MLGCLFATQDLYNGPHGDLFCFLTFLVLVLAAVIVFIFAIKGDIKMKEIEKNKDK